MSVINDLYRVLFGRSGTERGTDIDMSEHGRAGGISTGQPYKFVGDVNEAIKITGLNNKFAIFKLIFIKLELTFLSLIIL